MTSAPELNRSRWSAHATLGCVAILCLLAISNVFYGRLIAPAELYRKDQNKTMAYTVDMVVHGRFSLPRDVLFQPATKPPLYNWLAAMVVGPTQQFGEWAQKWPSVASSFAIAVLVLLWCRRNFAEILDAQHAWIVGMLASAIWMASKSTVLLLYIARPDMLQALCLIGAWMAGNATLRAETKARANRPAILFWFAITAAALAKGPAAIYPLLYVVLASKLSFGSWGRLRNFRFPLGLLLLFGSVGLWLFCAWRQDAEHVEHVLIGTEVIKRIAASNPEGFVKPVHYAAMWFSTQNPYWSNAAILVALVMAGLAVRDARRLDADRMASERSLTFEPNASRAPWRRFFGHPAGMAVLWTMVVVACLSVPKDKRQDFLLPAHPAVAIVTAYGAVAVLFKTKCGRYALPFTAVAFMVWQGRPYRIEGVSKFVGPYVRPALVTTAAYALKIGIGSACAAIAAGLLYATRRWVRFEHVLIAVAVLYWSEAMVQGVYKVTKMPGKNTPAVYASRFAAAARAIVGEKKVVSIIRSKHPILTIMGQHQGSYLTKADFEQADYVIAETSKFPTLTPMLKTRGDVPVDYGNIVDTKKPIAEDEVGLFKIDKAEGVPSVDQMVAIQRWVADWTEHDANPYRSKNTVWQDYVGEPPIWTPPAGDPWIERNRVAATRPWASVKTDDDE